MSTATIHRKDLTALEARIVGRFKHYLIRQIDTGELARAEVECNLADGRGRVQQWYKAGKWKKNNTLLCKDKRCYRLTMRQFRDVVACLKRDDIAVSEGLVINTLLRFSLFCLDGRGGAWKWPDGCIYLDRMRLSPLGTLKKRNPNSARAKLDAFDKKNILKMMETSTSEGYSYEETSDAYYFDLQCYGDRLEYYEERQKLLEEVAAANEKKQRVRAEIDARIKSRNMSI